MILDFAFWLNTWAVRSCFSSVYISLFLDLFGPTNRSIPAAFTFVEGQPV